MTAQRLKDLRKLPCNDCIARHLPCRSVPDDKCVHCKSWGRNCSHVTGAPRPTPAPPRPVPPAVPPPPLPPPAALVLSRAVPSPARPPNLSLPPRPSTSASVATASGVNSTAPSTSAIGPIPAGETEIDPKCAMCTMYKRTCTTKVLGEKCSQCAASGWSCSLVCYRCRQMNAKCTAKKDEPCVECVKKKRNCSVRLLNLAGLLDADRTYGSSRAPRATNARSRSRAAGARGRSCGPNAIQTSGASLATYARPTGGRAAWTRARPSLGRLLRNRPLARRQMHRAARRTFRP